MHLKLNNTHQLSHYLGHLAILAFLMVTSIASAQQNSATLKGKITDRNEQGLAGVNILITKLNIGTSTDNQGRFSLDGIEEGTYQVTFSALGFKTKQKRVVFNTGEVKKINLSLASKSLSLETVTVSTGTPTPINTYQSTAEVNVISGREKTRTQKASLGRTIEMIPGVKSINTGNMAGKPVIRGLSGNRVRVLHNGVAMDYQQFGVRHMPNIDPFMAKSIEIVQGPASILYGSDALGGAINYFPYDAPVAAEDEGFLEGEILGDFQSNADQATGGIRLDGASGGWGFSGSLFKRSADNIETPDVRSFSDPDGQPNDPKFTGELPHTDYEQLNGTFTGGYEGEFGKISANYTHWGNEHNFLLPNGKGLGQRITNDVVQLNALFHLNETFDLNTKLTYLGNLRQSNKPGQTRDELPSIDDRAHLEILRETFSQRITLEHDAGNALSGQIGIETRQTDQDTRGLNQPLVPSAEIYQYGFFAFEQYEWENLTLNAGVRADYRKQEAEPNAKLNLPDSSETNDVLEQDYFVVTGSLGATYQFTDNFAVSANVGRGFRAPSIFNLHVDGVHGGIAAYQQGNPYLDPETSLNTDLTLKWRSKYFRAQVTGYRNAIDNYIFLINTGENSSAGPPILRNVQGNAVLYGAHFSATAQFTPWLQVKAQGEWVEGENTDDAIDVGDLPLLPANSIGGEIKLTEQNMDFVDNGYFSLGVTHTFSKQAAGRYEPFWQFGPAFPFGRASTDAYTLINLGIGGDIDLGGNGNMTVDIFADNLGNVDYRDFLDTYKGYALSPGRNIGVRVTVPFTLISSN